MSDKNLNTFFLTFKHIYAGIIMTNNDKPFYHPVLREPKPVWEKNFFGSGCEMSMFR